MLLTSFGTVEKLYDGFTNILCGAGGMEEVNKRVGSDTGLQRAFGRERCAEQSVIQETLDKRACASWINPLAYFWPMVISKALCQLAETLIVSWRSHPLEKLPHPPYIKE